MTVLTDLKPALRGWETQILIGLYNNARKSRLLSGEEKETIMKITNAALKRTTGKDIFERREAS